MNKSTIRIAAAAVAIACATAADSAALPAPLPEAGGWTPLLLLIALVVLVGAVLLIAGRISRRAQPKPDTAEASTARSRDQRFAEDLKILWDKTTTTETLRARDDPALEEKR